MMAEDKKKGAEPSIEPELTGTIDDNLLKSFTFKLRNAM